MIDNRLALMTKGPDLAGAGQNALSAFMGVQQNKRRNKLLELNQQQAEFDQNMQTQRFDLSKKAFDLQEQQHRAATQKQNQAKQQEQLQIFAQMAQGLAKLPQGERAAAKQKYKEMYLPIYGEEGVARFDNLPEDDSTLQQVLSGLSPYLPAPLEGKVGRFRQFDGEDGKTYKLDTATGDFEVIAEPKAIDISGLPEEAQEVLKGQPPEIQEKAVASYANASNLSKQKAAEEQKAKADVIRQDALRITQELLADPSEIRNNVGSLDSVLPSITEGAQDFDKKLDTLRSMLTAENLKLMTGVLSESDIKILSNIASGELTTKGSEEEFTNALKRLEQKLGGGVDDELEGLINKYAD